MYVKQSRLLRLKAPKRPVCTRSKDWQDCQDTGELCSAKVRMYVEQPRLFRPHAKYLACINRWKIQRRDEESTRCPGCKRSSSKMYLHVNELRLAWTQINDSHRSWIIHDCSDHSNKRPIACTWRIHTTAQDTGNSLQQTGMSVYEAATNNTQNTGKRPRVHKRRSHDCPGRVLC